MLSGIGVLAIFYIFSNYLQMHAFRWFLEKFFDNLFLIVVILFQGEIRRALAQLGHSPFFVKVDNWVPLPQKAFIEELIQGLVRLAQEGCGALIVLEREMDLDYFLEKGIELNAEVKADLLVSLFQSSSPLHDGALLIREGRAHLASCFLPMASDVSSDRIGARHRAALGLTQQSDAVVFVVSEESHSIGIVQGGKISSNVDVSRLRRVLHEIHGVSESKSKAENPSPNPSPNSSPNSSPNPSSSPKDRNSEDPSKEDSSSGEGRGPQGSNE